MTLSPFPSGTDRSDQGNRPTPISRVWAGRKVLAEDLQGEDLAEVLHLHAKASAWWVIATGDGEIEHVADELGLDDLAVADLVKNERWVGYEEFDATAIFGSHAVQIDPATALFVVQPANLVMTDQVIICLAGPPTRHGFSPARVWTDSAAQLADHGVEGAAQVMITAVLDSYETAVRWLEDQADQLTEAIFAERPLSRSEQIWAFRLRAALSKLHRVAEPMQSAIDDLVDSPRRSEQESRRWNKIVERNERMMRRADALREVLTSVFQTSLALSDDHANQIMKRLTGWAAIIAVPTLVTGFVGMNVRFPLSSSTAGFWVYLVIMVVPVVILFAVFRRLDWI
ncbi:MAG: magnesium transporter CorA family protein [Propionibacteriaceae bacterium]